MLCKLNCILALLNNNCKKKIKVIWHCLHGNVQKGFITILGVTTLEFITANIDIFDFELANEEMAEINKLDNNFIFTQNQISYQKISFP